MTRRPIQSSIRLSDENLSKSGDELKEAMTSWVTGIAVVAVRHNGRVEAITVNSFISVSLSPPTVLVSLSVQAPILHGLDQAGRFTINVLAGDQARIASAVADRLPTVQRLFGNEGDPVLEDSIVTLVCTTSEKHAAGDHNLYLARVESVLHGRHAAPLLYYDRSYRQLEL